MKKLLSFIFALALVMSGVGLSAHAEETKAPNKAPVQLTDKQKKELAGLQKDVLVKKEALIKKYVEFGVIPKEKGDKILSHMDEAIKQLEEGKFEFHHHWHGEHHHHFKGTEENQENEE